MNSTNNKSTITALLFTLSLTVLSTLHLSAEELNCGGYTYKHQDKKVLMKYSDGSFNEISNFEVQYIVCLHDNRRNEQLFAKTGDLLKGYCDSNHGIGEEILDDGAGHWIVEKRYENDIIHFYSQEDIDNFDCIGIRYVNEIHIRGNDFTNFGRFGLLRYIRVLKVFHYDDTYPKPILPYFSLFGHIEHLTIFKCGDVDLRELNGVDIRSARFMGNKEVYAKGLCPCILKMKPEDFGWSGKEDPMSYCRDEMKMSSSNNGGQSSNSSNSYKPLEKFPLSAGYELQKNKKYYNKDGTHFMILQEDGNLAIYSAQGDFKWGSVQAFNVPMNGVKKVLFSKEGEMLLTDENLKTIFKVKAPIDANNTMTVDSEGNFIILNSAGDKVFKS